MKISTLSPVLFASLMLSQVTIANVAFPLYESSLPFILFPVIIALELIVFLICTYRFFKIQIGVLKGLMAMLIANFITSILGIFIFPGDYLDDIFMWTLTYVSTVFIEWAIYLSFFHKEDIKILDLLKISFLVNIISYALLVIVV